MKAFVKYGLWTGIVSGLWGLISFTVVGWLNMAAFHGAIPATQIRSYSGLFSLIILALGIYLGLKQARIRNDNNLTYGQAVKTGIGIAVITAVLVAIFTWFYCAVINPGYTEFMVQDVQHSLTAAGKTPAEITQAAESTRKEFSTGAQVAQALVGQIVVGILLTLIFGLFLRTKTNNDMIKIAALLVIALATVTLSARPLTGHPGQDPQQYILIVRYKPNAPKLSDDALKTNQQHWGAWIGQLAQGGKLVTAYRPATDGKTISGTAKTAKEGPYGSDQEVVSSIFIIKAASQDEADAIAKTCPIYETDGSIEIRPITDTAH